MGNRELLVIDSPVVRPDVLGNGKQIASELGASRVEGLGQKSLTADEQQEAGPAAQTRSVDGIGIVGKKLTIGTGIERAGVNARWAGLGGESAGDKEEELPSVRQEHGKARPTFVTGNEGRHASLRRHPLQAAGGKAKNDGSIPIPG